jgi:hypothetical protein
MRTWWVQELWKRVILSALAAKEKKAQLQGALEAWHLLG